MTPELLLAFDDEEAAARGLARSLQVPLAWVQRHDFPDGETRWCLPPELPPRVALLRGLYAPGRKLSELAFVAPAARALGAKQLVLVCPYLAYMRQDMAFTPGEAVSQQHVGALLGWLFDAMVTVDPHLHRVASLDEVVPGRSTRAISAAPLLGAWVARQPGQPALLLGPDEESEQWVAAAGRANGLEHAVCTKQRLGDRDVAVRLPDCSLAGRRVVLMDDVASTGHTLAQAARAALAAGAASVDVAVTHALLVGDARAVLRAAGVRHLWSTDAVPQPEAVVALADLLADALRSI